MIFNGLNTLSADSYFVRLTDVDDYYIHFDGIHDEELHYKVKKGYVVACIFHKREADILLNHINAKNIEIVKVLSVIPNDGTLN